MLHFVHQQAADFAVWCIAIILCINMWLGALVSLFDTMKYVIVLGDGKSSVEHGNCSQVINPSHIQVAMCLFVHIKVFILTALTASM